MLKSKAKVIDYYKYEVFALSIILLMIGAIPLSYLIKHLFTSIYIILAYLTSLLIIILFFVFIYFIKKFIKNIITKEHLRRLPPTLEELKTLNINNIEEFADYVREYINLENMHKFEYTEEQRKLFIEICEYFLQVDSLKVELVNRYLFSKFNIVDYEKIYKDVYYKNKNKRLYILLS